MASQAPNGNMFLPRAVVTRTAAIDARLAEQKAAREPKGAPPVEPALVVDPPVAEVPPPPPPAPPAPPLDPRASDPAYWQQRFKVTAGMLDTERAAHQGAQQKQNQRIAELESQVSTLQAGAPRSAEEINLTRYFTPDQIEKFGDEQCRVMAATAQAAAQDKVEKLIDAAVKPIVDKQKADQASDDDAKRIAFFNRLTELVPNYVEINATPGWIEWLNGTDPSSDERRQGILTRHEGRRNADSVAKMFKAFLAESTPPAPPAPPVAPHGTGAPAVETPPPPAAAGPTGMPTDAEVRAHYKRAALGGYKGKDAERVAFEARMKLRAGQATG